MEVDFGNRIETREEDIVEVHGNGWVVVGPIAFHVEQDSRGVKVTAYPNGNEMEALALPMRVEFAEAAAQGGEPYPEA